MNWADPNDNFVTGDIVPVGLSDTDNYATTYAKATSILKGFQRLGANTVRMAFNQATTSGTWWNSYTGAIDAANALGMNVVLPPTPRPAQAGRSVRPVGHREPRLPRSDMRSYLQHVADRRLDQLGIGPLYGSENPFAFMDLQDVQNCRTSSSGASPLIRSASPELSRSTTTSSRRAPSRSRGPRRSPGPIPSVWTSPVIGWRSASTRHQRPALATKRMNMDHDPGDHPETERVSTGTLPSDTDVEALVSAGYERYLHLDEGAVADYIPALAAASPSAFGVCVAGVRGRLFSVGDADQEFAIESISKLFVFALVCHTVGDEEARRKLGVNSTGLPFNSVMAIELNADRTMNPLVNAGAMATTSLVPGTTTGEKLRASSPRCRDSPGGDW